MLIVVLGKPACTVYNYKTMLESVIMHSHLLIAINRMWAVIFPMHYRRHHSRRMAICQCVATWVYVSAYMLPLSTHDIVIV